MERTMQWLRFQAGNNNEIDEFFEKFIEQAGEEKWVLIGQWYYYLHVHDAHIDLCRTQGKMGQPSLTEVIKPSELAISDEDLECAVHYWTCGSFEPGNYRISPLIERKLRILFE